MTVLDVLKEQSDEAELQSRREQAYRQKVIDAFFEYGRLKSIPAQRKKERIVPVIFVQNAHENTSRRHL